MDINRLLRTLKRAEGEVKLNGKHIPYRDSLGILTIGHGTNIQSGITDDEADYLLMNRLEDAIAMAETLPYWSKMNEARQEVIVEMLYQLGYGGFLGFRRMNKALQKEDYKKAAVEALDSRWAKQTPGRAKRLSEILRVGG